MTLPFRSRTDSLVASNSTYAMGGASPVPIGTVTLSTKAITASL